MTTQLPYNVTFVEYGAQLFGLKEKAVEKGHALLRAARALGWRPTTGWNPDLGKIDGTLQLELDEGACSVLAALVSMHELAESWVENSSLTLERWRNACLDGIYENLHAGDDS